jgi:hypothetical protein
MTLLLSCTVMVSVFVSFVFIVFVNLCIDSNEGLSDESDLGPGEADDAIGVFEAGHRLDESLKVNTGLIRTELQ